MSKRYTIEWSETQWSRATLDEDDSAKVDAYMQEHEVGLKEAILALNSEGEIDLWSWADVVDWTDFEWGDAYED